MLAQDGSTDKNMIFDTHAHYDDSAFDEDREVLLASLQSQGVGTVVNSGASLDGCRRTIELTEQYPFIYGALGVHPDEVGELNEETFSWLREQLQRPKIVAVGEIGLDYYWDKEKREVQKEWFIRQLRLARELKKPVVIHSREAAADTMEILKTEVTDEISYEMHCYSYSPEMAREYLKMGFYLGIGGVLTFKNAKMSNYDGSVLSLRDSTKALIENCNFINNRSAKKGGASAYSAKINTAICLQVIFLSARCTKAPTSPSSQPHTITALP